MDGHTRKLEGGGYKNAVYMQGAISEALGGTVAAAKEIMGYFQDCARVLADRNIPMSWTTPMTGARITQSYRRYSTQRINTLLGEYRLWKEDDEIGLDINKQALASAPNVIHSLDAAMLAETVLRCKERHGVTDYAVIHDSYGTHAGNTQRLYRTLREVAVDMYSGDWLGEFHRGLLEQAPGADLPPPPKQGDFDINEVLNAPYFFS